MPLALPSEGGCQCGAIRYRLTGPPVWLTICHCNECKRQSGGAFGMSLRMRASDVAVVAGAPKQWTRPSDERGPVACAFCETCGTRLWHEPTGTGFIHIKPGTLDDPTQVTPRIEAWTRRKAPWLQIAGLKMTFEGQPPPDPPT